MIWRRREAHWDDQAKEDRARRRLQWIDHDREWVENLAKARTPINDTFADGRGIPSVGSYLAALELRVAALEDMYGR